MNDALKAKLSEYDFYFVGDRSGSMGSQDPACGGKTRWNFMRETVIGFIATMTEIDTDGIGLVLFGGSVDAWDNVDAKKAQDIFNDYGPSGGTPLADALAKVLTMAGKTAKKDFIVVCTDGVPDDEALVKKVIIEQTKKQETDDACTILFIQVGSDPGATKYLQSLDDNLTSQGAKYDIVDAKTIEEASKYPTLAALIEHAIND